MTDIGPSLGFGIFGLLYGVIYLGIFSLAIYFMISTIKFFKRKTQNDKELLQKLDSLITILSEKNEQL